MTMETDKNDLEKLFATGQEVTAGGETIKRETVLISN